MVRLSLRTSRVLSGAVSGTTNVLLPIALPADEDHDFVQLAAGFENASLDWTEKQRRRRPSGQRGIFRS